MSVIFRPNNKFTDLENDNTLELNLTMETLQFMDSSILGEVPNRGFNEQADLFLTGIPYMQTVSDQLNETSGLADLGNKKIDLHFEQGLLLRVPVAISPDSKSSPVICRLGSIPHGTTINLQDFEPQKPILTTKPDIPKADITPFFPATKKPKTFDNMTNMGNLAANRKPANFTNLKSKGTIDATKLQNPNQFLTDFNDKRDFESHWTFTLKSQHPALGGGGVSNISFLSQGDKTFTPPPPDKTSAPPKPFPFPMKGNANATKVECTYWISTVKYQVKVAPKDYSLEDPVLKPTNDVPGVVGPQFKLQIGKKVTTETTINVTATQIQYSQNVTLDFGLLSWPHISVATLCPALPVLIPKTHPEIVKLS